MKRNFLKYAVYAVIAVSLAGGGVVYGSLSESQTLPYITSNLMFIILNSPSFENLQGAHAWAEKAHREAENLVEIRKDSLEQAKSMDGMALFVVGTGYLQGRGVEKDTKLGASLLEKASDLGNDKAQMFLIFHYVDEEK